MYISVICFVNASIVFSQLGLIILKLFIIYISLLCLSLICIVNAVLKSNCIVYTFRLFLFGVPEIREN